MCRFQITGVKIKYLSDSQGPGLSNQNAIFLSLWDKAAERSLVAVTTHLKAGGGYSNVELRRLQVQEILHELSSFLPETGCPVILCGDFNASYDEAGN